MVAVGGVDLRIDPGEIVGFLGPTVSPAWLRLTMTYLVPVGFAVTVPSASLTGRMTWERVVLSAVFLVVALAVTRIVWRLGTKHDAGASA